VLFHSTTHKTLFARGLVDGGEEFGLFMAVMLLDAINPGNAVANKVRLVSWGLDAWGMLVNAVEAAYEKRCVSRPYAMPRW
jgi:hypothetical protein